MIAVLSRQRMQAFDRHAIEQCRVPSLVLMENAGRGATEVIAGVLSERRPGGVVGAQVCVVCGPGNNGGDGFVVARRLLALGARVQVYLATTPDRLHGDALLNHQAWVGLQGPVASLTEDADLSALRDHIAGCDLVVDGLFGTGLDREIAGHLRRVIEVINEVQTPCVALDIPSGLDANRGAALGVAVRAVATVTFAHHKLGLLCTEGAALTGRLHVVDIGVPGRLHEAVGRDAELLESADVAALLGARSVAAHKGDAGRVLAIAGSAGKTGAALLVGTAALRAGAGLVWIGGFPDAAAALDQRVLEVMTARIDPECIEDSLDQLLRSIDVVVIGPGMGLDQRARRVVDHVVMRWAGTTVVDADALTHLAGRASELRHAAGHLVLTPHPGEMGRLLGCSTAQVEADRFAALARSVELTGAVVLLKGPRTLVGAPGELPVVNAVDCPALATAGAGDVLAGICGALACSLPAREAAFCAAHVHTLAARRWSDRTGADRGLLAHEVADAIPGVLAGVARLCVPVPL
jgi:hydroxyethylthiazole kinase-like uncharacterized protein yjeF